MVVSAVGVSAASSASVEGVFVCRPDLAGHAQGPESMTGQPC
jgi:hypothetical protein